MATRMNALTEGGILAAVMVVLGLVGLYVPFLGVAAILLWSLPAIVLIVRHGPRWGTMSMAVATVLLAMLLEPMVALRLALGFGPMGLALGYGYRAGWSGVRLVTTSIVVSILAKLAGLGLLFFLTGAEPFTGQLAAMESSFDQAVAVYESMGLSEEQIEQARATLTQNLTLVRLLLPLIVVMMGLTDTILNYYVAGKILARLGNPVPVLPPFTEWRLSGVFLYLFALSILGIYWGQTRDIPLLYQASVNFNMVALMAGLVEGLSLYGFLTNRLGWGGGMKTFILLLIFFVGPLSQILAFMGLFDTVFDYRRRYRQAK
ncbi:MAG: YybS family protein [Schwartzia sp.]|nr:YybS family protein [Schwartzia sp. (in: firmicutes)]